MDGESTDECRELSGSRRSLLRASGGAIAAASLLSGCTSSVPLLDDGDGRTGVDVPPGGSPSFRKWIPADGVHGVDSLGTPWVFLPSRDGSDHLGAPLGTARSFLKPNVDYLGVGVGQYDLAVLLNDSVVLEGPADPETVGETLLGSGYEAAGRYHGYDVYERFDTPRSCAIREGSAVWARGTHHQQRIEAHIDAEAGRVDRLHDVDQANGRLVQHVGARPVLAITDRAANHLADTAAGAFSLDVDENGLYRLYFAALEPGADPSRSAIRERFAEAVQSDDIDAISVTIRDGIVTMAAHVPLEAAREAAEQRTSPPQITWGVDPTGDRLVLRHEAGDSVTASRLELLGADGESHSVGPDPDRTIGPSAELAFDRATIGAEFTVHWSAPTGEHATLFQYGDS